MMVVKSSEITFEIFQDKDGDHCMQKARNYRFYTWFDQAAVSFVITKFLKGVNYNTLIDAITQL